MKFIKAAGLVMLGSLVVARFAGPVHAQQAQADAAASAEFMKTCSAEIGKMKATLRASGEEVSDAEIDGFLAALPAEIAKGDPFGNKRADAAFYREAAANVRAEAAKPNNPDKSVALMAPVYLCLLDVLIRLDTEGGAAPASPSGRAAAVDEGGDADGPPSSSNPFTCVRVEKPGQFRNRCPFPVYFTYCGVNPEEGSSISDCTQQKMTGLLGAAAGGIQGGFTRAEEVYMFACEKPEIPTDVKYVPGKGLRGSCR